MVEGAALEMLLGGNLYESSNLSVSVINSLKHPMDLDSFYSENQIKAWETVLGEKMHYHNAINSEENDPFDQAVLDLCEFIRPQSKVLDCGCGWGGPARLLRRELNCDTTGITISKAQANYIDDFPVFHEDLEFYTPSEKYDVALFIESYTHIQNTPKMLKRFHPNVESIVIKDFVSESYEDLPKWGMKIRSKAVFTEELESAGYKVKTYYEIPDYYQPATDFWINNLKKLKPEEITGQLRLLYELCHWFKYGNKQNLEVSQCVIHATR